jgi:hypothetical protein
MTKKTAGTHSTRSVMFPHITFTNCAKGSTNREDHVNCDALTCDMEICASEYWEAKRVDEVKAARLALEMSKFAN